MTTVPRLRSSRRAFSVVEIVLVLATLGTLVALVAPRFAAASENAALDAAARRIVAELEAVRERARASSSIATVQVNTFNSSIRVTGIATDRIFDRSGGILLGDAPYEVTVTAASFGGAPSFRVDARGEPTIGGTITIARGSSTRTITVASGGGASWK